MSDEKTATTQEIRVDPGDEEAEAWWTNGGSLEFMGFDMNIPRQELLETIDSWRDLIKRFSKDAKKDQRAAELVLRTRLRCGMACCLIEDWTAAMIDLEAVRDGQNVSPLLAQAATLILSSVYAAQRQYEQAIACWSAILAEYEARGGGSANAFHDKVGMIYLFRAQLNAEQRQFAEALSDCDKAECYLPECAEVFSVRGLARANLGDLDRALADCKRSIELDARSARCFRRRGTVHRMRREWQQAIADFDRALELDPTDAFASAGRSEALLGYVLFDVMTAEPAEAGTQAREQETPMLGMIKTDSTPLVESAN